MKDTLLEIIDLNKYFSIRGNIIDILRFKTSKKIKVIDNINLKLSKGEILVVAGESGSGKTTLAKLIMRSIQSDSGKIIFDDRDITNIKGKELLKLRSGIQMIFQDPYSSLDPRMKIFDIIKEPLEVHQKKISKKELIDRVNFALKKVNLDPDEVSTKYPHMLSGGQRQRVSFARALVIKPSLIIADEPVSMLDVSIRFQILDLMKKLKDEENVSFLYITHDLSTSQYVGDKIIIIYRGQIIEQGNIHEVLRHPLHPYTKALISAIPRFNDFQEIKIKNEIESSPNFGCKFLNKCLYSSEECKNSEPTLIEANRLHFIRCYNYESI
ncbi:MAG TPA: ABC transporter ATP-binding protein [Nitrososphaeraceae archaeon]|nr:ABC transporter ATP-binding protein [Nitrososphaeraceae archaeon]